MNREANWRGRILPALLGAAILLFGFYVVKGLLTSEEDRIRAVLHSMADAAEEGKMLKLASHLTKDFVLDPDEWSRGMLQRALFGYFRRVKGEVSFVLRDIEVEVMEDRATATLRVGMAQGGSLSAGLRPDRAYSFRCHFVKKDGEWKIERAVKENTEW
ncbi:MAG: nuclear transport factor 2 family protein [Planctomycetota bacterium]|nr:nuclear transport factor 2 family protein [Planctomycetota bacterium]